MKSIPELLDAYKRGIIPEALLFSHLIDRIGEKSVDEILSVLDESQRARFLFGLVAVSKPDWISLDGWRPSDESLLVMRDYLRKTGKSSSAWQKRK
jgi:hypothetical protein